MVDREYITTTAELAPTKKLKDTFCTYIVSFAVLSERFSFWGLQAVLVVFLMQSQSQSQNQAFTLIGAFGTLCYAFSLLGGILSDKSLGIWRACLIGLCLCITGNIILAFSQDRASVNLGLACILVGAGLFSPGSSNLIRMLYEKKPALKESGFLSLCVAGNISGALSPLIYGIFGAHNLWYGAFLLSAFLNCVALLGFLFYQRVFFKISGFDISQISINKLGNIITFSLVIMSFGLLMHVDCLSWLLLLSMIIFGMVAIQLFLKLPVYEKKHIGFALILTIILLLFYIAVFQIYSSMTVFISQHVNRTFLDWDIPIPAFASLQCIFFILCAPVVDKFFAFTRKLGYELSLLMKIPVGLLIATIGFLLFARGEWLAQQTGFCSMTWIVWGNLFLGLGEVFMYPAIIAAVATFSPKRWAGTLMGAFSISLALASYFAGQLAMVITAKWGGLSIAHVSILQLSYANIAFYLIAIAIISAATFSYLKPWYIKQYNLLNNI